VVGILRITVVDDDGVGRPRQLHLDRVEADHAADLRDIERAILHRHAIGHVESRSDGDDFGRLAPVVADRVDISALGARSHEERAAAAGELLLAEGHRARILHAFDEERDLEPGRKLDSIERAVRLATLRSPPAGRR
jgi:hypothetical protein